MSLLRAPQPSNRRPHERSQGDALLLDCDGVIVHSEPLNFACWNDAYEQVLGIRLSGDYRQLVGLDLEAIHALWCRGGKLSSAQLGDEAKRDLLEIKSQLFRQRAKTHLKPVDGIRGLIQRARRLGWPLAVVSAALGKRLELTLRIAGLSGAFDLLLSGEDIPPGPEPLKDYRRAARELSVPPEACVVVEDSASGVRAARIAGIGNVFGLTTSYDEGSLRNAGAHWVVSSLAEVQLSAAFQQTGMEAE